MCHTPTDIDCNYRAVPNVFEGDISAEEEVLDWLIEMKVESHVELITRAMLETMVEEVHYLAVYFCETKQDFTIHKRTHCD